MAGTVVRCAFATNSPVAHHEAGEIDRAHSGKRVEPHCAAAKYTNDSFLAQLPKLFFAPINRSDLAAAAPLPSAFVTPTTTTTTTLPKGHQLELLLL